MTERSRALGEERSSMLKQLAAAANFGHRWARASAGAAVAHLIAAGNALARARDLCDDGEWSRWVRTNFDGSLRTAQRYVRLARHWPEIGTDATSASPRSRSEGYRAIRRALFGPRALGPVDGDAHATEPAPPQPPSAGPPRLPSNLPRSGPRPAALAVAGLERLATSIRDCAGADPGADYVVSRIAALAVDLRLDVSGRSAHEARGQVVYFVEALGTDRVKIGVAGDPVARLAGLQTACPHPLVLLATASGGAELEAALHRRYSDFHLGGEWFHLAKPLRAYIERLTAAGGEK